MGAALLFLSVVMARGQDAPVREYVHLSGSPIAIVTSPPAYFTDIPGASPYYNYANLMKEKMITGGCWPLGWPAGQYYCPDELLTRGQMAVFIVRAIYSAATGNPEGFSWVTTPYFPDDVPATHDFFKYIQKLRELEITKGCWPPTAYCPDAPLTRAQMSAFTMRAWQYQSNQPINDAELPITYPNPPHTAPCYPDVGTSHLFFRQIQRVGELGVANIACQGAYFYPDDGTSHAITRGLASLFIGRVLLGEPNL